ncbi:hypothetical protein [Actinomadura parmotrematis]|uniref:DUF2892 domain-containing protein n=1 Tax=Actinomadura parmotrematis TaxID=2864039 RepID=A0ABS7G3P8_9ACTN|nr:hypothetical protein [Actinomadura parmotrematis]MBW8487171.1 hypothetical protein [Actinomadura parmotrematis]
MRERSGAWMRSNGIALRALLVLAGTALFWSRPLGALVALVLAALLAVWFVLAVVLRALS